MRIKEILDKHGRIPEKLIEVLLELQSCSDLNYLRSEDIKIIADEMNMSESRVYSIAQFYSLLSTKPRGKYILQLCHDVPCYINGSTNVIEEIKKKLNIDIGETTSDNMFTLEFSSCLGCCENAPVMQVGDTVYTNLTSDKIDDILNELRGKV